MRNDWIAQNFYWRYANLEIDRKPPVKIMNPIRFGSNSKVFKFVKKLLYTGTIVQISVIITKELKNFVFQMSLDHNSNGAFHIEPTIYPHLFTSRLFIEFSWITDY